MREIIVDRQHKFMMATNMAEIIVDNQPVDQSVDLVIFEVSYCQTDVLILMDWCTLYEYNASYFWNKIT